MRLTDILTPQRVKVPLTASRRDEAIAELVDLLVADGAATDRERLLQAILDREKTRSTGIGGGLAIPHGKCAVADDLVVAVGRCAQPVDFASVDGKGVSLIVLLAGPPEKTGAHIQALARIARMMSIDSFRNKLIAAPSAEKLYQLISDEDQASS